MRVRVTSSWKPLCAVALVSAMLGACGSSTALLNTDAGLSSSAEANQPVSRKLERTVSYRPALGPPEGVNASLTRQLNIAALEQGIALIVDPNVSASLTLRGYVGALRKGHQVSLSYVWDVVDERGQRVNRIAGEETIPGAAGDPWAAVTPDVARALALKTMGDLAQWVRSAPPARPASPALAGAGSAPPSGAGVRPAAFDAPAPVPPPQPR